MNTELNNVNLTRNLIDEELEKLALFWGNRLVCRVDEAVTGGVIPQLSLYQNHSFLALVSHRTDSFHQDLIDTFGGLIGLRAEDNNPTLTSGVLVSKQILNLLDKEDDFFGMVPRRSGSAANFYLAPISLEHRFIGNMISGEDERSPAYLYLQRVLRHPWFTLESKTFEEIRETLSPGNYLTDRFPITSTWDIKEHYRWLPNIYRIASFKF